MNITIIDTTSLYISVNYYVESNYNEDTGFIVCKTIFDDWFLSILDETKADKYIAFDDLRPSFRTVMFSDFKANRIKPNFKYLKTIVNYAREKYNIKGFLGLESDDLVAIAIELFKEYNVTIAHIDSDINQKPGNHFNYQYRKKNLSNGFYYVNEKEANLNFFTTLLIGGHNNNKGLMGCGKKTADSYLSNNNDILSAYINGIKKNKNIRKEIQGLGLIRGTYEFYKNVILTKLIDDIKDANYFLQLNNFDNINEDFFKLYEHTKNR